MSNTQAMAKLDRASIQPLLCSRGRSCWELQTFFLLFKISRWKIEILFHYIFQEKDPLKSLDDIFPEAEGKEGQPMLCVPSLLGTLDQCLLFSLHFGPCTADAG